MSIAESIGAVSAGARQYDVCIIGSGAAGITLAMELAGGGRSVLLLEAGPEYVDEKSQSEYEGDFFGPVKFPLDVCRLRVFGGSTNHWGGFCRTLDDYDFRPKVDGVDTGWPIGRADLDPYLARAGEILEIPAIPPDQPLDDDLKRVRVVYSPPVHFSRKFRPALQSAADVTVALNATVVNFRERSGRIDEIEVRDASNGRHFVRARRFVLCGGGIENSRLLLWANRQNEGRVAREAQALGRYWMEHPHFTIGEVVAAPEFAPDFDAWRIAWFSPSEQAIRRHGILNCGLRVQPARYDDTKKMIAALGCVAPELGRWALSKVRRNLVCGLMLRASWEQAPRPWNRVALSQRTDDFGMPRADLHWRLSEFDKHSVRTSATLLGEYLVRSNLGRVRLDPWVLAPGGDFPADDEIKGNHHMGGTRMSTDPGLGVVDTDLRVHGSANLYVCGSSVFPGAGHANPTLTIVQLACRLARHLKA